MEDLSETRNGETYFYHYDGSDNVRMLTDSTGNVVSEYGYDSQGNLLFAIGSIENNFLFSGQQYDQDAGLYYHRARYRDTNTGRFTQMDQYSGRIQDPATLHKYTYAHNDPINLSDPSGRISIAQTMSVSSPCRPGGQSRKLVCQHIRGQRAREPSLRRD